jgi:hypothetical protein
VSPGNITIDAHILICDRKDKKRAGYGWQEVFLNAVTRRDLFHNQQKDSSTLASLWLVEILKKLSSVMPGKPPDLISWPFAIGARKQK